MMILPSKKQWSNWHLPSKLTAVGTYLAVITAIITILAMMINYSIFKLEKFYWIDEEILNINISSNGLSEIVKTDDQETVYKLKYPVFKQLLKTEIFDKINFDIKNMVSEYSTQDFGSISFEYKVELENESLLSISFKNSYFLNGSMNDDNSIGSINVDLKNKKYIEFFDIFDYKKDSQDEIKKLIIEKINKECINDETLFYKNSYMPRFILTKNYIYFIFSEYEITIGACGSQMASLSYNEIAPYIKKDGPLGSLTSSLGSWEAHSFKYKGIEEIKNNSNNDRNIHAVTDNSINNKNNKSLVDNDARILNNGGYVLFRNADYEGAILSLKKALKISPSFFIAKLNLAKSYCANNEIDKAKEIFFSNPPLTPYEIESSIKDGEFKRICTEIHRMLIH